jgi:hypothetical protein
LLAVGADEEDLAGSDAVVDPDLVCSYVVTCFVVASSEVRNWSRTRTMADTGMSAIRWPSRGRPRNMRT